MTIHTTLIEFIKMLLGTDSESIQLRDYFREDPQGALHEYGLGHLSPEDVHDAMVLVQDNDTVSFDRNYDTGFDGVGGGRDTGGWDGGGWDGGGWDGGGWDGGRHHDGGWGDKGGHQDPTVREHVTNNHVTNNIDDRDTVVDNSVNQNIDTGGGDLDQHFENNSVTASGDGAVAAGRDIEDSTVTTGHHNVVGDDNAVVNGDADTTAFGSGSAVSDARVDDGGALSVGGDASGDDSTHDSFNDVRNESHESTSVHDSYNTDSSSDVDTDIDDHSSTHTDVASHNSADLHFA